MQKLRPIVIIFPLLLLGGCAAWPVGDHGDTEPWPLPSRPAFDAVNLAVHGTFEVLAPSMHRKMRCAARTAAEDEEVA